jgi:DNA-binding MarR family transcriptional regulator
LRRLTHSTEQVTKRYKLTPRRYELLLFIEAASEAGAPATVTSLCEPLQTTQGSVTQLVEGAVRAGLLKRVPVPSDRRSATLHLTHRGRSRLSSVYGELGPERDRIAQVVAQASGD